MNDFNTSFNEPNKNGQDTAKSNESLNPNPFEKPNNPPETKNEPRVDEVNEESVVEKEKYLRVRFQAKSHPNDTEAVPLGVNGEILNIQRQVEVTIPERYVEVARHAKYPHFKQVPGEQRKQVSEVILYPFELLGEGKEEDFLKMKKEGTEELLSRSN